MRRVPLLLAALVLAFPLAACGGGDDETTAPETVENGGGGETTAETETDEGTTTEEGATTEESESGGDAANGKEVFASAGCGSCHVLSDAGTSGTVGPNLDDAMPSADLAVERVTNGSGVMPSFQDELSEQEIQDVAAYVSSAAGS